MPQKKKILIVAESIDVEDSSGSKANVGLILNLKDVGFEVLVYHYTRKEIQLPGVKCIAIKEKRSNAVFLLSRLQRKLQHGLKINLAKHLEPKFGFSFTFFNDVRSIAAALRKEKDFRPDIVLTLSKGASFRPHYALLNTPNLHEKWMAYIHDPYPFHYYPEPYNWSEPGYEQKIKFFAQVSQKCRWAAFPSQLLKEWMEEFYPAFKEKGLVIPHQMREENEPLEVPAYFDPEKFNLLHAGNLMKQRDPFPLIQAFQIFLNKNPDAAFKTRLLLVGSASYHISALKKKEQETEQLVVSDGYVPYDLVLEMQEKASANIILESAAEVSPFLPGKFPHCVAANKLILHLGPEKSEVRRLLGSDYEYYAEANDVEMISAKLEQLYVKWKADPESLQLNREDLHSYLSTDYLKKKIENLT
ncbi:UDP-glycosyltransferase [Salegentibacter sp. F188]|uniref:UDP-glycosyltransferase n=1 Tax=Autumnicola patrickiae TaxID=3075591 RepID=A0ABU3DY37_9FLAO|nr:UDP-glycosyltransferase [Salegentibacter sp. F188]MDT0688600.1 UDP-glycosyltransferase [Salegentibacter sp. F188]